MTVLSACYVADAVLPWWHVYLFHQQDMQPTATPDFDLFDWTGLVFIPGGESVSWIGNHQLDIKFKLLAPPAPPPKPTVTLPIFNRDYRSHYGAVEPPFGPLDIDPC